MSWTRDVYSTMVSQVGWDDETGELLVTFKNGRTAAYSGVDEGKAIELSKAASVGDMMNSEIKGKYPFRYV